jgi:NAD(P)-dependent dehydrogenase (short-subunit alcohol dehydrogenase family)
MTAPVVFLTGACGDIGSAIALDFAQSGAKLILLDIVTDDRPAQLVEGIRHAGGLMKEAGTGGRIVFISSWVQDVPSANIAAYCVSKSGLKMLAKCMALELGRDRICVNVVAPGFVDAGLSGRMFQEDPGLREKCMRKVPLGYVQSASDVARAVKLVCSPGLEYMTGSTLLVDGGNSLFFWDES